MMQWIVPTSGGNISELFQEYPLSPLILNCQLPNLLENNPRAYCETALNHGEISPEICFKIFPKIAWK